MTNKQTIDKFFSENYQLLLEKSKHYCQTYKYDVGNFDELISDIYIEILSSVRRLKNLTELIKLSAATINNYNYDNLALFYIIRVVYNHSKSNTTVSNRKKRVNIKYCETIRDNSVNTEEVISNYAQFELNNVLDVVNKLAEVADTYYKIEIWRRYYIDKMTIAKIAEYYKLSRTPVFQMLKQVNKQIKNELLKTGNN